MQKRCLSACNKRRYTSRDAARRALDTMGDGCAHTTLTSADAGTQPKASKESES